MSESLTDGKFFRVGKGFKFLAIDGLGGGRLSVNLLHEPDGEPVDWGIHPAGRRFTVSPDFDRSLMLVFDRSRSSATLLGRFTPASLASAPRSAAILRDGWDGGGADIELPALLHFPDYGSVELSASQPAVVRVRAARERDGTGTTTLEFPAKDTSGVPLRYEWKIVSPHPRCVPEGRLFEPVRRNFLNALQLNPQFRLLANSTAGGPGPFALWFYSGIAAFDVELTSGLSTLDILRQSVERFIEGFHSYGMAGYQKQIPYDFLDTYPSLLIAAADYAEPAGDAGWVSKNYSRIRKWAEVVLDQDTDGDGLLEYPACGNSGSWPDSLPVRPSNWWDTIGFGHKNAYGNTLAAEALRRTATLAAMAGHPADAERFLSAARRIREAFVPTFFNPNTGIIAGWRSADGCLHDHWFLFVNSLAVLFGLVETGMAHSIMDRMLAKLDEVGFNRFDLGLPGNLVPVPKRDYVHHDLRWGGGVRNDNRDGFQIYENGGATACFAGFTIEALYKIGRLFDGDRILFPMLEGFDKGHFQGPGPNGRTKDWRSWGGDCHGYEGLLADGYLSLRAALRRPQEATSGVRQKSP